MILHKILALLLLILPARLSADVVLQNAPFVAEIEMQMMILPGTKMFLEKAIAQADAEGAKLLIIHLNTPGGMLETTQEMVQAIFGSAVPVVVYVGPSGGMAASAGVFITMAGHVAAMAPGTSIGAAHPVSGDGKDIEGDMRLKAENITSAMVKSISEQRGRNAGWAEKAVRESSSLTEKEALRLQVVDIVAPDVTALLQQLNGREVQMKNGKLLLADFSRLPRKKIELGTKEYVINILANPNVAALLWLAATTGLSIELYNPGAILPGVVGVICLVLALTVSQIIPVSQGGLLLLLAGGAMLAAELFVGSGLLGIAGVIAVIIGSLSLVDSPGMGVELSFILPIALVLGGLLLTAMFVSFRALKSKPSTGSEGLVGMKGRALDNVSSSGRIFVNGEIWKACAKLGLIEKDAEVIVRAVKDGLVLEVEKVSG